MASKKKKKFSEQVLQGEYKSSLSRESVAPALKKTNASVTKAYAQPEEKKWYQEFLKTSKTFSDGYDVGDVSKAILGTATDIENKLGKGFLSIFEAPVDIGTYATSTVLDVFGADKQAEKVKKFGQRNLSEELADKYTKEASILATGYNTVSKTQDDYKKVVELYKSGNIEEGREATKKMLKDAGSGLLGLVTGGSVEQLSSRAGLSPEKLGIALDKEKLIEDIDNDSISGDTLDQVAELVGYMTGMGVATSGLNAVTGTAKVGSATTGASVSGGNVGITVAGKTLNLPTVAFMGGASGGLNEAYQKEDVTHAQAWTKGLSSGMIESVTEGMFGVLGVGGNELTDQMATKLAKKFSSSFGKQISNMAVKGGGEAFEELASYTLNWLTDNNVIDKMEGADFSSEFDWEEASEQMALALISGGVLQGSNTALHVNAEANNIINQIEQETGRPLTREERKAIRSETAQKVIELQNDESLQQGLTEENIPVGENVQVQTDEETRENLVRQLKETKETKGVTTEDVAIQDIAPVGENVVQQAGQQDIAPVVEQTGQQVNEADLKRRNYTYVASETDSHLTRELKESASRVMNDTKRSHEFVETVSKIAERTQTKYRFTNTEELNALGYGVEGRRVNGLVTKNGEILINIDSQKALNTIIGHETTHLLEGTKEYKALQDAVFKYAQTKGDFVRESDRMSRIYAGQKNVNIDNELTSELVGDYLFTDQQFLNELASEQPSIVRKIYNEIKHWIKMATAGSKEARQLEDLKYRFEKALSSKPEKMAAVNETKQTTTQETKDKSVVEVESNTQEKVESVQEIETEETSKVSENVETETKIEDNAEEYSLSVDNKGRKLTEAQEEFFEDSVVRDENGNLLTMYHGTSSGGYTIFDPFGGRPGLFGQGSYFTADNTVAESYTEKGRGNNKQIYEVYLNITKPIDMDGQANVEEWKQYFSKHIPEATFPESGTNEALYRFTLEEFENTEYDRVEVAEIMVDTFQKMGYDGITHIGGGRFNQKDNTRHRVYITFESNQIKEVTNKNPTEDSDIRYSLSEDNQGRELSKEQQEYFKDSKVRDSEGRLLEVYHGTPEHFSTFEYQDSTNSGQLGADLGFWFTPNERIAKSFSEGQSRENVKEFLNYRGTEIFNLRNELGTILERHYDINDFPKLKYADTNKIRETLAIVYETFPSKIKLDGNIKQTADSLVKQITEIEELTAEDYAERIGKKTEGQVIKVYLNIKNLKVLNGEEVGTGWNRYGEIADAKEQGYDGVLIKNGDTGAGVSDEYVVFNSNQIKNVDNTNPTDSDDIRYSLSEDNEGRELSKEKQEQLKDSKFRDENGNIKVMYHGTKSEFDVFDINKAGGNYGSWSRYGRGFYFTDKRGTADFWASEGNAEGQTIIKEKYLNATNPFVAVENYEGKLNDLQKEYGLSDAQMREGTRIIRALNNYGYDSTEALKKYGFDGVEGDGEYVIFDSEQIIDVDNTTSVRYSLSEEGEMVDNQGNKVTLEASDTGSTRNLMAIHNLNENKFKGIIELGGFPVPSIAITKPEIVNHSQFGGISVLFDKSTIDPANPKNEVYDRDVWSPTFPRVEYDINGEDIRKYITKNLDINNENDIINHAQLNYMYSGNLSDRLDRLGKERLIEEIKNDKEMKYLYKKLVEKGEYTEPTKPEKYSDKYSNETLRRFIDSYNRDMELPDFYYHYLNYGDMSLTEQELADLKQSVRDVILPGVVEEAETTYEGFKDKTKTPKDKFINSYVELSMERFDNSYFEYKEFIRDASRLYKFGEQNVIDKDATLKEIGDKINQEEFEKWVDDTFGKMLDNATKGIRNDKDPFTSSGNRRSFKALHEEYNLRNVVEYLTSKKTVGGEEGFGAGSNFGTLQAKMSNRFSSIEDIKSAEDRIQFGEEVKEKLDNYSSTIYQYMSDLREYSYNKDSSYYYGDNTGYALNDFAGYKTQNMANLKKALENNGVNSKEVPTELLEGIVKTVNELKYIPTDYFEAKPQRAVGLDEVQAVVIPNDVSPEFKQQLQDAGLTYYEYDRSIEGDRQRVINQFDELKFSLSNLDEDIAPVGNYNVYGSEVGLQQQVEDAIAPLQEKVEELTKVITDLQENIAPASFETAEEQRAETQRTLGEGEAPLTDEGTFQFLDEAPIEVKNKRDITYDIQNVFNIKHTEAREIYNKIASMPELSVEDIYTELEKHKQIKIQEQDDYYKDIQNYIKGTKLDISEIKKQITDYDNVYRMANMGKGLTLANSGQSIDSFYQELNELYPNEFPDTVTAEADQLDLISQAMFRDTNLTYTETLDDDTLQILAEKLYSEIGNRERYKSAEAHKTNWFRHYKDMLAPGEEPPIKTDISYEDYVKSLDNLPDDYAPYLDQAIEINASNTEQTAEDVSITNELNRLDTQMKQSEELNKQKALEYLERLENEPTIVKNPFDEILYNFLARARRERTQTPVQRVEKSKLRNALDTGKRLLVNEMAETDNLAHEKGNLNIKFKGDMLNSVAGEIEGEIYTAQTDNYGRKIGESVSELFAPAKESGLYEAFDDYLAHYTNIDRHLKGKGSVVPADLSQKVVAEYEKTYPQFKDWGAKVWRYGANARANYVDAGLISQETSDYMGEIDPHYVPFIENRDLNNYFPDLGEIKARGFIKRAVGGANQNNLLLIEEALTKYTFAEKKAVRQNQFYQEIVRTLSRDKNNIANIGADVRKDVSDLETSLYRDETGNYLTAYFNGQQKTVRISDDLYTGLKNDLKHQIEGLEQKFAIVTDPVQKISEIRRNLLTSWNPMFIIRNPLMDIQDAVFNSKYTKDFLKHYNIKTFMELGKANTETARQFLTLYGSGNVMGEFSSDGRVKNAKFLKGIQRANNIMELAPRFAEFKASLDNGASIQEAMYNAREVTTNFSRGGTITKALNKNGFTFLNVSVQGFDKFIRNFSGENGAKGVAGSLLKAVTIGVLPALFNELAFGGDDDEKDEDYDALPDYIKDNYYLFKTGDGEFIRIPKGRILSVFGSAARRTLEYLQGEEDAFEGFLKNANSQIGVSNPLDSNILTPLFQAFGSENGEAWYGGDIVPKRLQDKAPEEQYDASTDKFSIWLGDKIGVSPYKINYVLDQYSGGIGDIFLPMITDEATNDAEGPGVILAPIKDAFTSNSTFDNKYAGDIYDLSDKMDKLPTATKETDEYKIQDSYLYSVTSEMAELYAERREVQANKNLSKKEKYAKVQEIQKQINSLAKEGLDNYQNVNKTDNYAIVGGREFNKYTTDSGEERWGAVFSDVLDDMNSMGMDIEEKSEYFKATSTISSIQSNYEDSSDYVSKKRDVIGIIKDTNLNDEQKAYLYDKYYGNSDVVNAMVTLDVDIDSYLDYESQNFEADKDSSGKSISGSKKRKVFDYINSMPIDFEQRVILAKLQYPSYDEYNAEIVEYLNSSDMTYEQEIVFLKKLGFTVDEEGYIYW